MVVFVFDGEAEQYCALQSILEVSSRAKHNLMIRYSSHVAWNLPK